MAINITKLLEQKPTWIHVDEPISASTDPQHQDASILADGSILINVEGVSNRNAAQLWGSVKLMADIFTNGHNDDGSHALTNDDIAPEAAINESKIDFTFRGQDRPSGGQYETTNDLAEELGFWAPYYQVSAHHAATDNARQQSQIASQLHGNGYVGHTIVPNGIDTAVIVADDEYFWFMGRKVRLYGTNSNTGVCQISVGPALGNISPSISRQTAVWVELWEHNVTQSGVLFPYGNTQYKNTAEISGTHGVNLPHSDQHIAADATTAAQELSNPDNNCYLARNGDIVQLVYALRWHDVEYEAHDLGLSDADVRSIRNLPIVKVPNVSGTWAANDGSSWLQPMAIIMRRNKGIYHPALNPAGTAIVRSGSAVPSTLLTTYDHNHIAYFDGTQIECPDYVNSVYSATADTYTLGTAVYYRSGAFVTRKTARPDSNFFDVVNQTDVDLIKPQYVEEYRLAEQMIGQLFANRIKNRLTPTYYGTVASLNKSDLWGQRPLQVVALGQSEAQSFGTNNLGGVFIDQGNNYLSSQVDGVRTVWSDRAVSRTCAFSFIQGNGGSESKPQLITYEPTSRVLTVQTTGLSGNPLIASTTPVLLWEDGTAVTITTAWTGLGTESASCVMDAANATAHAGQQVSGSVVLDYPKGGGLPFKLQDIVRVEDHLGRNLSFSNDMQLSILPVTVQAGSTDTRIVLPTGVSNVDNFYVGQYLVVLVCPTVTACAMRRVVAYDAATRTVTLDSPLPGTPSAGNSMSMSSLPIEPYARVIFDPLARGVHRSVRRAAFTATSRGTILVNRKILYTSAGTISGTLVKGLTAGDIVDIIFEDEAPFVNGCKIWFYNTDNSTIFRDLPLQGQAEILNIGKLFATNIGSGNDSASAYQGLVPGSDLPLADGVRWIGTTNNAQNLSISITNADAMSWENIVPWNGIKLDYATLETNLQNHDGSQIQLGSTATVTDQHSGLLLHAMLVRDADGYKLIASMTQSGKLTLSNRAKMWSIDLSKLVADTNI